jgi:hypothetical protein
MTTNGCPAHFYHDAPVTSTQGPCEICCKGFYTCTIDHIHMCLECSKTYIEASLSL